MTSITLHNTKTRKKEALVPIKPGEVSMYVCGPTVYDRAHIGNARPVIVFDTLFRLLRHVYGADRVSYVRNFTDVDDKINARAAETGQSIREITDGTIALYLEDMDAVGALHPTHMPRATEYIQPMVDMTADLIEKGHAYEAEGHVLFAVESYADYGKFSGRSLDDMIAGSRVEVAPYKRNPMDFVLWKPSDADTPGWASPWGKGRPGWHIECSAMAHELLGESFDIHGGGNDLMFPHHENEIAQSKCAGHDFANIWMHNEMLQVEGKKMSKSLGNFFTVRDLLDKGVPGEVIRFVMLSTHYRKPMDWTERKWKEAEATLRKWRALVDGVEASEVSASVLALLSDDLNTAGLIAEMHRMANTGDAGGLKAAGALIGLLGDDLGDWMGGEAVDLSLYSNALSRAREQAMQTKNFSAVDDLKTALTEAGVEVRMSKEGVELVPTADFDPSKLEGLL
ncbi:cysteine--tRNA ligase [Planktotalea arctica]|uniref:cysteine--tRNA ligase n=1 Tax=Planktotalea arctica TaxID=1481893 RepID=UPI000A174D26|nr:cysteine--tRNA ligase [Planktotalea arctica]